MCGQCEKDALTMALRLMGESEETYGPECREVMSRWEPKCVAAMRKAAGLDPDLPEFLGGPGSGTLPESPLRQIERKIGAVEVLLVEIDALSTKIRRPEEDPELFDGELHRAAFDLGLSLADLYRKAWEINREMARKVDEVKDELSEIHACRNIAARRGM